MPIDTHMQTAAKATSIGKHIVDAVLGLGAATSLAWWPLLQSTMAVFMMFGGAVLLVLRILIAREEYRLKKSKRLGGED